MRLQATCLLMMQVAGNNGLITEKKKKHPSINREDHYERQTESLNPSSTN